MHQLLQRIVGLFGCKSCDEPLGTYPSDPFASERKIGYAKQSLHPPRFPPPPLNSCPKLHTLEHGIPNLPLPPPAAFSPELITNPVRLPPSQQPFRLTLPADRGAQKGQPAQLRRHLTFLRCPAKRPVLRCDTSGSGSSGGIERGI